MEVGSLGESVSNLRAERPEKKSCSKKNEEQETLLKFAVSGSLLL